MKFSSPLSSHLGFSLPVAGSQAAAVPAEVPSQLDHIRSAVGVYLTQVKESAVRALDNLDDTEYSDYK